MSTKNKQWKTSEIKALFEKPFFDLIFEAHQIHKKHFPGHKIQVSSLLNIKTGACPEDCAYCPQSSHYNTGLQKEKLWKVEAVIACAKKAKAQGANRFCMAAAWKYPPKKSKDFETVLEMIKGIKALGMQTCVTLGMLKEEQAKALKKAGLNYYNHNLDTSREYYPKIIKTRDYQERLDTLEAVRKADLKVCCGGIIGMGESQLDQINLLKELANLPTPPQSVPINQLMPIPGTPLENAPPVDPFDFVRIVAIARILMPKSRVRISAGRTQMDDATQALCFFAGANSFFMGEKLLTAPNPSADHDQTLMKRLGLSAL